MASKESHFIIGLFVTSGFLIGVIAVIWLGATKYLEKGKLYVTYFDESVEGIEAGSSVEYRGVEVGRVEKIEIAPDDRLIGVVMSIRRKNVVRSDTEAQLKTAGLTGIGYVNLYPKPAGEPLLSPKLTFKPKYPVIPSHPSEISQILSQADLIVQKIREIDFKGISEQVKSSTKAAETFFSGPRMTRTMENLAAVTADLDRTINAVDSAVGEGKLENVLAEARSALVETRTLVIDLRREVDGMKLSETGKRTGALIERLDSRSRAVADEIRATAENLRRSSETLEILLERLSADPSSILFSKPPAGRDGK
jgi:phospholipid/cholesterol/gamma-HCH transport system substrate-binding protein